MEPMDGFVDRPTTFTYHDLSRVDKLVQTSSNGKAILVRATTAGGGYRAAMWDRGYRLHLSRRGAPAGYVFAWVTKVVE